MLRQLNQLSIDADGRYATATELQFIKDYLKSVQQRISAYEKIRDAEDQIMEQVEAKARSIEPNVFQKGSRDTAALCRRDRKHLLRYSASAMLINNLDRLRDGLLVWQRTIVHAVKDEKASQIICRLFPEIVKEHLSPEEANMIIPALQLDKAFLG